MVSRSICVIQPVYTHTSEFQLGTPALLPSHPIARRRSRRQRIREEAPNSNQKPKNPTNNEELTSLEVPTSHNSPILLESLMSRLPPPLNPPLILGTLRLKMRPRIKVTQRIPIDKPHRILRIILFLPRLPKFIRRTSFIPALAARPPRSSVSTLLVETGRWTMECSASLT